MHVSEFEATKAEGQITIKTYEGETKLHFKSIELVVVPVYYHHAKDNARLLSELDYGSPVQLGRLDPNDEQYFVDFVRDRPHKKI